MSSATMTVTRSREEVPKATAGDAGAGGRELIRKHLECLSNKLSPMFNVSKFSRGACTSLCAAGAPCSTSCNCTAALRLPCATQICSCRRTRPFECKLLRAGMARQLSVVAPLRQATPLLIGWVGGCASS